MASPVGEDNWLDYVESNSRGASARGLEAKVGVIEDFERAIAAEAGSIKVWIAYCEYFWSLYSDCQPGSDAELARRRSPRRPRHFLPRCRPQPLAARLRGRRVPPLLDSHELWNRWIELEMELLARTRTDNGVRRISQLFRNRLEVPHAAWDRTSQMFSTFLSSATGRPTNPRCSRRPRMRRRAKRIYEQRDAFEMKLVAAAKSEDPQCAPLLLDRLPGLGDTAEDQ